MAEGLGHQPGGIFALVDLIDEHYEAVEADLLDRHWRLSEVGLAFSWRDLLILVRRFQADPATATARAIHGDYWSTTDQVLAAVYDVLQFANWQRAGKKSAPKPKPLPRPWEKARGKHLGSNPVPVSRFAAWWDSKRKRR